MQGFYVAKGNPKEITTWEDLTKPSITIVNREKGSGTRVLLDGKLRLLNFNGKHIKVMIMKNYHILELQVLFLVE